MRTSAEKDIDLGNLCISAARARLVLQRQRQIMVDMVRDYAGPYWGAEWQSVYRTQPINLLALFTSITLRSLISRNPRAMLSTFVPSAKPMVAAMEDWFNLHVDKINLQGTLKRAYLNMMFTMAITKVSISSPVNKAIAGWGCEVGEPYAELIDFDDYVYDVHTRVISQSWQGHRFRMPLDVAKKFYGRKARDLEESEDRLYNMEGDERISVLGRGFLADKMEYRPMVDLWEFWLPWEGVIVTVADDNLGGPSAGYASRKMGDVKARALKIQKWIGPAQGPYYVKHFIDVPGNAMGKGPLQDIWDLHDAVNNIARKQIEQARRQKELLLVQGGADADGNRVIKASDGEVIRVDNPQNLVKVDYGGPNNLNYVLMNDLIQRTSWVGGNFEVQGGLSAQGKTATQEKILNANANETTQDLASTATDYAQEIIEALLWFHYHHPVNHMHAPWAPKGLPDMQVTRVIGPEHRQHIPWEMLRVKIDPYSMQHQNPGQRMQAIMQVLQQVLVPLAPVAQQAGRQLDFDVLLAKIGKYMDDPDFEEIMGGHTALPQEQEGGGETAQPGPQETTHVRVNAPGRTAQGDQMNLRNALMGVDQGGQHSNGMANGAVK